MRRWSSRSRTWSARSLSWRSRPGRAREASRENEQLRELLDLQAKRRDFVFESAKVTARSSTNWDSTLTIGKGAARVWRSMTA